MPGSAPCVASHSPKPAGPEGSRHDRTRVRATGGLADARFRLTRSVRLLLRAPLCNGKHGIGAERLCWHLEFDHLRAYGPARTVVWREAAVASASRTISRSIGAGLVRQAATSGFAADDARLGAVLSTTVAATVMAGTFH